MLIDATIVSIIGWLVCGHYAVTWGINPATGLQNIPVNHPFYNQLGDVLFCVAIICLIVGNILLIQASLNNIVKGSK